MSAGGIDSGEQVGARDGAGVALGDAAPVRPLVIGLDLSLTATGVACSSGWVQTIKSKGKSDATLDQRHGRLHNLRLDIALAVNLPGYKPDLVVIEAPAFSRTTGHMHDRSGLWWMVVDWLSNEETADGWGLTLVEVTATGRAKYATGKGNAGKDEVLAAVVRRYPTVEVSNNNEADALILAAMGARHLGHPIDDLPLTHLAAMAAVKWPEAVSA